MSKYNFKTSKFGGITSETSDEIDYEMLNKLKFSENVNTTTNLTNKNYN
jgi:hypothetical protein